MKVTLDLTINKGNSTIELKKDALTKLNKTYDKNPVDLTSDDFTTSGSNGAVSLVYEQKNEQGKWIKMEGAPVNAGMYRVTATLAGNDFYNEAPPEQVEFEIEKAKPKYEAPTELDAVYGQTLKDVTLTEGFTWEDSSLSVGNAGTNTFKAVYTPIDTDNYQTVDIDLTITVKQAKNEWTQPLKITGWTYGEEPTTPTATAKYGEPTFWYSNQKEGIYTEKVPTSIGTWYVKAIVAKTDNYSGLKSDPVSFTISQRWVPSRTTDGLHQAPTANSGTTKMARSTKNLKASWTTKIASST